MIIGFAGILCGYVAAITFAALTAGEWAGLGVVLLGLGLILSPLFRTAPNDDPRHGRGGGRSGVPDPDGVPPRAVRVGSHWLPEIDWKWPEQ